MLKKYRKERPSENPLNHQITLAIKCVGVHVRVRVRVIVRVWVCQCVYGGVCLCMSVLVHGCMCARTLCAWTMGSSDHQPDELISGFAGTKIKTGLPLSRSKSVFLPLSLSLSHYLTLSITLALTLSPLSHTLPLSHTSNSLTQSLFLTPF